jgi:hypothetical protein
MTSKYERSPFLEARGLGQAREKFAKLLPPTILLVGVVKTVPSIKHQLDMAYLLTGACK